jgi:NTE family protein
LSLPKGVIAGVSIESFFRDLSTPAFGITDFNKLPIPFRRWRPTSRRVSRWCSTVGSLAQAMRASMSVPGAIAPIEIDGKLLVDGGHRQQPADRRGAQAVRRRGDRRSTSRRRR